MKYDDDPQDLIDQAAELIEQVDAAIEVLKIEATKMGIKAVELRDTQGGFPLNLLLHAKAQAMRAHSGYLQLQRLLREESNAANS